MVEECRAVFARAEGAATVKVGGCQTRCQTSRAVDSICLRPRSVAVRMRASQVSGKGTNR